MKIHHFPKDTIAMAANEAKTMKEREQYDLTHGTESNSTDVSGSGHSEEDTEATAQGTSEKGGAGGVNAPSRPKKKAKKAQKDISAKEDA